MKKSEHSANLLSRHPQLLLCPHCGENFLSLTPQSIQCKNGHVYNLSKKGSLHLLKNNHKGSYDKKLFLAREQINKWGMFHKIYAEIKNIGKKYLSDGVVLDMGAGEGSLLQYLASDNPTATYIGLDNSKEAIQRASSKPWHALYLTADLAHPPFTKNCARLILNFFAPANYPVFSNLLESDGLFIKVIPGENYLKELRNILYADKKDRQSYDPAPTLELFYKHFPKGMDNLLNYTLDVTESHIQNILDMSPLSWGADSRNKDVSLFSEIKKISMEVHILQGKIN